MNNNRCANTEATDKMYREQDKAELILEHEQNELYKEIEVYLDGLNHVMKYFAMYSVMDKQEILEYVRDTVDSLLEIK